jgi:hypothetical protein
MKNRVQGAKEEETKLQIQVLLASLLPDSNQDVENF